MQFNNNSSITITQNANFGSNRISLSKELFDKKIEKMSFEEYSKFLDDNIHTKIKKEIIHFIKFDTKIEKLYFYEELFDETKELEIELNESIKKIILNEK